MLSEREIKAIARTAEKLGREVGVAICCKNSKCTKEVRIGTRTSVRLPACETLIHTHFVDPKPSRADIVNAKAAGVKKICIIHVPTRRMECYDL